MRIPSNNQWKSVGQSDLFGTIIRSKNLDLTTPGYAALAPKSVSLYTSDDEADFGRVVAIAADDSNYYAVTDDHVYSFNVSPSTPAFTELTSTNQPSIQLGSDAVRFNSLLTVSGSTTVKTYSPSAGGSWTDRVSGLSSTSPHPMCVFENRVELAVGNANTVITYNTSYSSQNTLTLPTKFIVTTMRWKGNTLYIGTRTIDGSEALVFLWNGTGSSANAAYGVGADWVYSLCEFTSSVVALTSRGQLLRYNGAGFDELPNGNFPIYYTPHPWTGDIGLAGVGKCLNRGMAAVGNRLYINIDGSTSAIRQASQELDQPSGVWIYDPNAGLYHHASYAAKYRELSISSLQSSHFVMAAPHGAQTGDAVWPASVSNISALSGTRPYYAIVITDTSLQLAGSLADALAGRALTLSGTISGDKLTFHEPDAMGDTFETLPGALATFNPNQPNLFFGYAVLFSGSRRDAAGDTIHSVMSLGMGHSVGHFVTPKILANGAEDFFQSLAVFLKPLIGSQSVTVKYRTRERTSLPANSGDSLVWLTGSTFSINTISDTALNVTSVAVGDEVEFVGGAAAGYSAHVTNIDKSSSTYVFTIDEDFDFISASDMSTCYFDNWTEYPTDITADTSLRGFGELALGQNAAWIQFKVEMRGLGIAVRLLQLTRTAAKP